jgi:hypothetical protein
MKKQETLGTPFETRNNKEERKFFYMHNKLLFIPDAADAKFGNSMKDASYSEVKLFIEVLKGDFNTLSNKAGVHNNGALKSLNSAISTFFNQKVRNLIKEEFLGKSAPSTQDYFKLKRSGMLESYKKSLESEDFSKKDHEKRVHDLIQDKELGRQRQLEMQFGSDKYKVSPEYNAPTGKKFDNLIENHINKEIILTEIKTKEFNLADERQLSNYILYVERAFLRKEEYSDYTLKVKIIAPSINENILNSLIFLIGMENLTIDQSDF